MSPSDKPSRIRALLRGSHRWTRRLATLVILLLGLAVVAVGILWVAGGGLLARRTADFLNAHVLATDTRVSVGEVSGFPMHHMVLEDATLLKHRPGGWFPFVGARKIQVSYDLWGFLHGRYVASRVEADGLRLELRSDGEGSFLFPAARSKGAPKGGGLPPFRVGKLLLHDASVHIDLPWRGLDVDSVEAEARLEGTRKGIEVRIDRLTGIGRDGVGPLVLAGGTIVFGDGIHLDAVTGQVMETPFTVAGTPSPLDLQLTLDNFPLPWLGTFLGEKGLDPGRLKHLEGRIHQTGGGLVFSWSGAGTWEPWTVTDMAGEGAIAGHHLRFQNVRGTVEGSRITDASIDIPLRTQQLVVKATVADFDTAIPRIPFFQTYRGVVNGRASVIIEDRRDPLRKASARLDLGKGHLLKVPFLECMVTTTIDNGTFAMDTVKVNLQQATVRGRGTVGTDSIDLSFGYLGDLRPWRQFLHRQELEGWGQLRVRLHGGKDHPELQAAGRIRNLDIAHVHADEVDLEEALGAVGETADLEIRFAAPNGIRLGDTPFSSAKGRVVVSADSLVMDSLELTRGDTAVTVAGDLRWEPEVRIHLDRAEADLGSRRFWVDAPGGFTLEDDVLSTEGMEIHTSRGSFRVAGSWNTKTQAVNTDWTLHALDPSVFFDPAHLPPVAVGKMGGTAHVEGTPDQLNGNVDLGLRQIDWKGGHLDSLYARLRVTDRTLSVEQLVPILDAGRITVSGDIVLPEPPVTVVRNLAADRPPDPDATVWNLTATASGTDLARWRFLLPPGERALGRVDAVAHLEGTSARPRLDVEGSARTISVRGFEADTLQVRASFADGTVSVDRLRLFQGTKRQDVTGTFPLDLTLYPFSWSLPERPMNLLVEAQDGSLMSLRLTPWIKTATGSLKSTIRVSGTPAHPSLNGEAEVENGKFSLKERDEVVVDVTARIRFDGDLVTIEEAKGKVGVSWSDPEKVGGWATASGTYRLGAEEENSYRLNIHLDKVVVGESGQYAARVSGDLTLTPKQTKQGIFPFAQGNLFVERAEYSGSLQPQDIGEFKPPSLLYDVRIDAPTSVFIRTEGVDAELGGENLIVRQTPERQEILGQMDIHRGTYEFSNIFQKTFHVTDGTLTWDDPETRLPTMDITADTREGAYLITVKLTGRVGQPDIQFSAEKDGVNADLTQEDILQLLAVGAVGLSPEALSGSQQIGAEDVLGKTVGSLFTQGLEARLARKISMVDELQIGTENQETGAFGLTLGARKYVTPNLSIQYVQGLSSSFRQDLAVEYRLRRALYLRGGMVNREDKGNTVQEYNLDLKLRHEY